VTLPPGRVSVKIHDNLIETGLGTPEVKTHQMAAISVPTEFDSVAVCDQPSP
jgi:hypothetical protein